MKRRRRLAIFDIGSTLVESTESHPATRIAGKLGLTDSEKRTLNSALMTSAFKSPRAVGEFMERQMNLGGDRLFDVLEQVWVDQEREANAIDGAMPVLEHLSSAGYELGLLSNIWHPYLTSVRSQFGSFFDEHIPPSLQVFSYLEGKMKPDPDLLGQLLSTANVEPRQSVMIGDTYSSDIRPAIALGMNTIWVLKRPQNEVHHIERVLNAAAPSPTFSTASIVAIPELLSRVFSDQVT